MVLKYIHTCKHEEIGKTGNSRASVCGRSILLVIVALYSNSVDTADREWKLVLRTRRLVSDKAVELRNNVTYCREPRSKYNHIKRHAFSCERLSPRRKMKPRISVFYLYSSGYHSPWIWWYDRILGSNWGATEQKDNCCQLWDVYSQALKYEMVNE